MPRRTCPACPKRYAGLVDTDCPVCDGVGVLALGAAALQRAEPAAVARAVELYLEVAAREAAAKYPPGPLRRDALGAAANKLRLAGVIGAPLGVSEPEDHTEPPVGPETRIADYEAGRVVTSYGLHARPQDVANLDAAQHLYGPDDRPHAAGLLPHLSAAGYPSQLVRAADPVDALGPSTRALVYARMSMDRIAAVIARAVDHAAGLRERRTPTAGTARFA